MTANQIRIAPAIRLSHIRTDRFKTGILTITLTAPLNRANFAHNQLLPALLRRGTVRYPDMAALNLRLDELYASAVEIRSNRFGNNLSLVFTAEVLDQRYVPESVDILAGVLEVMAEMLLHPKKTDDGFDAALLAQERRFAVDAIRSVINNTRAYGLTRLRELMHRDNRDFPTMEESMDDLSLITPGSLSDYHKNLLVSSPLEFFYVGSLSGEEVAKKISTAFGEWKGSSSHCLQELIPEPSAGYCSKTEVMPVSQGKLSMGFRTGVCAKDHRLPAMLMLNELLGGSAASKLFVHVREELSLCYYCSSAYNKNNGILTVSAGIENKNRTVAQRAILSQLSEIQAGNITDAEWNAARTSLEHSYRQIYDNPLDLQSFYGNRLLFGITQTVEEMKEAVASVTPLDVITLAGQIQCDTVFYVEGTAQAEEEADDE